MSWKTTLDMTGAKVERLVINRFVRGTYYARLILSTRDDGLLSIDCRPSDGLALALSASAPIYTSKGVADLLGQTQDEYDHEKARLGDKVMTIHTTERAALGSNDHRWDFFLSSWCSYQLFFQFTEMNVYLSVEQDTADSMSSDEQAVKGIKQDMERLKSFADDLSSGRWAVKKEGYIQSSVNA